jgi:hypothetical protein
MLRILVALVLAAAISLLAGCGGDSEGAQAPGSPENPLRAQTQERTEADGRSNEAAAPNAGEPGYQKLVDQQSSRPQTRFSPCNLVTAEQARAIVGGPVEAPLEAPQGPTCIYRSRAGDSFVTLAVQSADFDQLSGELQRRERVDVGEGVAYCGNHGQPTLYARVSASRVLAVGAPCAIARQFAARAVQRL